MLHYTRVVFIALAMLLGFGSNANATTESGMHRALAEWISESTKKTVSVELAVKYVKEAYKAAERWDVDPLLLLAFMKPESGYRANAKNKSGASGLMQVIPRWHREKIAGRNIMHYKVNIDVGAQVINEYLAWHGENMAKAMKRYSGGAGKAYGSKIAATYRELRDVAFEWHMHNNVEIVAVHRYNDPRRYTRDLEEHAQYKQELAQRALQPAREQVQAATHQQDLIHTAYLQAMLR